MSYKTIPEMTDHELAMAIAEEVDMHTRSIEPFLRELARRNATNERPATSRGIMSLIPGGDDDGKEPA